MTWKQSVKQNIEDPLRSFRTLQVIIASVCILIPLALRLLDHDEFYPKELTSAGLTVPTPQISSFHVDSATSIPDNTNGFQLAVADSLLHIRIGSASHIIKRTMGFRTSISDYVNGSRGYVFGILYSMASLLFIFNGVVYLRSRKDLRLMAGGHWLNVYIGLSLLAVALCPERVNHLWHTVFTVSFFAGNIIVLAFIANPGEKRGSKIIRIAMAIAVLLALFCSYRHWISLLWAEWISLLVFAIHLILATIAVENKPAVDKPAIL